MDCTKTQIIGYRKRLKKILLKILAKPPNLQKLRRKNIGDALKKLYELALEEPELDKILRLARETYEKIQDYVIEMYFGRRRVGMPQLRQNIVIAKKILEDSEKTGKNVKKISFWAYKIPKASSSH